MKCLGYLKFSDCIVQKEYQKGKIKNELCGKLIDEMGLDASAIICYKLKKNMKEMDEYWQKKLLEKCSLSKEMFTEAIEPKVSIDESLKWMAIPTHLFRLNFTLDRPYFSRDDELFYFMQNPVMKESVFKVPMVRASTWKGKMRWVGMKQLIDQITSPDRSKISTVDLWRLRKQLVRLFGNETKTEKEYLDYYFARLTDEVTVDIKCDQQNNEYTKMKKSIEKNEAQQGYLNFFPTYFHRIDYEVTNKLNDQNRTGDGIVKYEVVPADSEGEFTLLYAPFDWAYHENISLMISADLECIRLILRDLFFVYGFSAKGENWGIIKSNYQLYISSIKPNDGKLTLDQLNFGGEICAR